MQQVHRGVQTGCVEHMPSSTAAELFCYPAELYAIVPGKPSWLSASDRPSIRSSPTGPLRVNPDKPTAGPRRLIHHLSGVLVVALAFWSCTSSNHEYLTNDHYSPSRLTHRYPIRGDLDKHATRPSDDRTPFGIDSLYAHNDLQQHRLPPSTTAALANCVTIGKLAPCSRACMS